MLIKIFKGVNLTQALCKDDKLNEALKDDLTKAFKGEKLIKEFVRIKD